MKKPFKCYKIFMIFKTIRSITQDFLRTLFKDLHFWPLKGMKLSAVDNHVAINLLIVQTQTNSPPRVDYVFNIQIVIFLSSAFL